MIHTYYSDVATGVKSRFHLILVIGFSFLLSGLVVLRHIINHNDDTAPSYAATSTAQTIYATLGFLTLGSIIGVPWLIPAQNPKITPSHGFCFTKNFLAADEMKSLFVGFRDPLYVVGWAYIFCWCLLQLLLQQPINSMPVALLLLQIMASIICFSNNFMNLKQWVEVAALYSLGMAGHFALGNTNTLATIDVAGAFIGISSHSTILSGILMFFITYASPMLAILSLVMYTSLAEKNLLMNTVDTDTGHFLKTTVCFPCLVPLGVNSILLLAYTIVLLLMRNHLFVWSVFSPKYLYVCATTVCIYVGVVVVFLTAVYTTWVVSFRRRRTSSTIKDD